MCPSAGECLFSNSIEMAQRWPGVTGRKVILGGVAVTCEQAMQATRTLENNGSSAIKSVLGAIGNPLAGCDYWAVCRPYYDAAKAAMSKTGGIGPKGRHLAKDSFARAIRDAVTAAACAERAAAFDAIRTDERYASAMALAARGSRPVLVPAEPEPEITTAELLEFELWHMQLSRGTIEAIMAAVARVYASVLKPGISRSDAIEFELWHIAGLVEDQVDAILQAEEMVCGREVGVVAA